MLILLFLTPAWMFYSTPPTSCSYKGMRTWSAFSGNRGYLVCSISRLISTIHGCWSRALKYMLPNFNTKRNNILMHECLRWRFELVALEGHPGFFEVTHHRCVAMATASIMSGATKGQFTFFVVSRSQLARHMVDMFYNEVCSISAGV